MPSELQLPTFRGMVTYPTYNLNGDPKSALEALQHPGIGRRLFVSKTVWHGVIYDHDLHARIEALKDKSQSLRLIWEGMEVYLEKHTEKMSRGDSSLIAESAPEAMGARLFTILWRPAVQWTNRFENGPRSGFIAKKALGARGFLQVRAFGSLLVTIARSFSKH